MLTRDGLNITSNSYYFYDKKKSNESSSAAAVQGSHWLMTTVSPKPVLINIPSLVGTLVVCLHVYSESVSKLK